MDATLHSLLLIIFHSTRFVVKLKVIKKEIALLFGQQSTILNQSMITMLLACQ